MRAGRGSRLGHHHLPTAIVAQRPLSKTTQDAAIRTGRILCTRSWVLRCLVVYYRTCSNQSTTEVQIASPEEAETDKRLSKEVF